MEVMDESAGEFPGNYVTGLDLSEINSIRYIVARPNPQITWL